MSAWDDYMKQHGAEEYSKWDEALKPMTDRMKEQDAEIASLRERLERAEADTRRQLVEIRAEVVAIRLEVSLGRRGNALGRTGELMTLIDAALSSSKEPAR
jgi:hypothetical protein